MSKRISEGLGEGAHLIHNKAWDPIFLSKDGVRKVRFDFNRPAPHDPPPASCVWLMVNGKKSVEYTQSMST